MSTTPQATPEPNELATAAAPVSNLRKAATGVIPKQMQSWIFLTVIFVAAVGLWFSSGSTKAAKSNHGTAASAADQVKPVIGGLSPEEVQTRLKRNGNRRPKCGGKCTFESATNHRRAVQRNLREPKQTIRRRQKSIDGIPRPDCR